MPKKSATILNSLLTLILLATIYQFIKSEYLGREISSVDRGMQRAQQQIGELKEAASSTFEQTMRRFDDFGRQLQTIAQASKNARTAQVAAVNRAKAAASAARTLRRSRGASKRALITVLTPYQLRREEEAKLNRDRLQFLRMRTALCNIHGSGKAMEARTRRCEERTRRLGERGNSAAQTWLGAEARDKKHDLQLAAFWFEHAADQGDTEAMDDLASLYSGNSREANEVVSDALVDPMKTLYWYSKAAGRGDPNAMGAIASIYQEGRLTAQNPQEAVLWYRMAAKAVAPLNRRRTESSNFAALLGDIYYKGDGVEQDKVQAYEWYDIACDDAGRLNKPDDPSCASRDGMAGELRPVEVAKAQALAAEWEHLNRR
jgi:TPR repeat protein